MSAKHPTDFSKDSDDGPPPFSSWNDSIQDSLLHPQPQEQPNHPLVYPPVVAESSFKTQEKRARGAMHLGHMHAWALQ